MINSDKYKLHPEVVTPWGYIVGEIANQKDLVEYISTHGGGVTTEAVWGSISGNISDQEDLMSKFGEYATEAWVSEQGYLTEHQDLTGYATESWVEGQGYITSENLPSGLATQSWVENQGYLTSVPEGYATESWVSEQGYLTSHQDLTGYATQSWVSSNFLSSVPEGYATESWVGEQGYLTEYMADYRYPTFNWIEAEGLTTRSWVQSQGYAVDDPNDPFVTDSALDSVLAGDDNRVLREDDLGPYAQMEWVQSQGYLTSVPSEYATQSWVSSQGYLTSVPSGYATQSWVQSQGYIGTSGLSSYATQSWVSSQGFYAPSEGYSPVEYNDEDFLTEEFGMKVLNGAEDNGDTNPLVMRYDGSENDGHFDLLLFRDSEFGYQEYNLVDVDTGEVDENDEPIMGQEWQEGEFCPVYCAGNGYYPVEHVQGTEEFPNIHSFTNGDVDFVQMRDNSFLIGYEDDSGDAKHYDGIGYERQGGYPYIFERDYEFVEVDTGEVDENDEPIMGQEWQEVNSLLKPIPAAELPQSDGTYTLQLTMSSGVPTFEWIPSNV